MSSSKFFRLIIIGLAMMLVTALAFGGGKKEAATDEVTLRVTFRTTAAYEANSEVQQELERILGFKINFDARPPLEYDQTTQAILASGDYPDLMEVQFANPEQEIRYLAEDNVIIALDDLLDRYGQNVLEARPHDGNWYRPLPDGKAYSIQARFNGYGFEYGWLVRQDYLDNLGLTVPTTLDEFRNVARAMTFNDPNQTGRDDTYGIDGGWPSHARGDMFNYVLSAHGVLHNHWQELDGELVHWAVNPATRDALRYMRDLYQEGLVDPEFPIIQRPQWLDNMRSGRYGTQFWWNTHLDANTSNWWNEFEASQPNALASFMPPAPGPDGVRRMSGGGVAGYGFSLVIFDRTPEPNRVAAMRFVDYLASEEGAELAAFGIEGKHWTMENGNLVSTVSGSDAQARAGTYLFGWIFRRNNVMPTSALAFENLSTYEDYVVRPVFEDRVPAESEFGAVLNELTQSRFLRIQTESNINVDAEWPDFVRTWMNAGGREMTAQKNAAWRAQR